MKDSLARLVAAVATAALLSACGATEGGTATPGADATASPIPTTGVTVGDDGPAREDGTDAGAGGSQLATVALNLDGQPVPIATACTGADGAVLVTTEGEVTITVVREGGVALRYSGEGMSAETSDVTVEEVGESTVYRATLQSEEVPAVDVTVELGDTSTLEGCQAGI